ncbi:phytoene/squalene synthase family protein [Sphingomonas nostoxanthinifaciens]|uniref:phytoene/squalene synthase family protein n=1 Tax=Sphingomonas nostoxanthinifaciens TaxID=2872652 RepID=UPI001CC1DBC4|nr:phytoene/squalene synthase family protein [Sphingomonas nostoxanthinifaciens]UAK24098.1 phytoene/squalene synthase family protein [Sphingomonas nostoxanthinifaciens]
MTDRAALVAAARVSIARGSKSFRFASTLFDRRTREKAWLLYAWCRACDDLADGQEMGHGMHVVDDAAERLATIRTQTARALAGLPTGDAAFDGFGVVARECGISAVLADDLIEGFALDAAGWRPRTEEDLYRYCYHVAGAVGVMMALVMGVKPSDRATLGHACDLGMAFQLANIARDITEDAAADRCYLPSDWLAEAGIAPREVADPRNRPALALLAQRLAEAAAAFEATAKAGTPALGNRSAWAVLSAAGIYGGIARKVARRGSHAWDARVVTSKLAKLGSVLWAAAQAATRWRYGRRTDMALWRPSSLA